jgi:hypothetical protein
MENTTVVKPEITTFNAFTIAKDFEKYTVLITRPSPRARLGMKIVHHYSFRSTDISKSIMRMNLFVEKFIADEEAKQKSQLERKANLQEARNNFTNPYTLGQILYNTWGYEQTNVDFYQVIKVDRKSITVRALSQDRTETGFMQGKTVAIKDDFLNEKDIKKIIQIRMWSDNVQIYVNDMSPWDGSPISWSSYY